MKRKIIEIDAGRCNGCGLCVANCPEGAIQLIDGKARLVGDLLCDGLGACIGTCPEGAIRILEREAEPYDERKVMDNVIAQGEKVVKAHLQHLKNHGEFRHLETAMAVLRERNMPIPALESAPCGQGGCPGSLARRWKSTPAGEAAGGASALRQWPIQLKLINPAAEYFQNADLLVAADCVAYACGNFHRDLLSGRVLVLFCPKLDSELESYVEKLAEIFRSGSIRSVTVARMEVPCCGGTTAIVEKALKRAGMEQKITVRIIGIDGSMRNTEEERGNV